MMMIVTRRPLRTDDAQFRGIGGAELPVEILPVDRVQKREMAAGRDEVREEDVREVLDEGRMTERVLKYGQHVGEGRWGAELTAIARTGGRHVTR